MTFISTPPFVDEAVSELTMAQTVRPDGPSAIGANHGCGEENY
jgi:hypothetical protein